MSAGSVAVSRGDRRGLSGAASGRRGRRPLVLIVRGLERAERVAAVMGEHVRRVGRRRGRVALLKTATASHSAHAAQRRCHRTIFHPEKYIQLNGIIILILKLMQSKD